MDPAATAIASAQLLSGLSMRLGGPPREAARGEDYLVPVRVYSIVHEALATRGQEDLLTRLAKQRADPISWHPVASTLREAIEEDPALGHTLSELIGSLLDPTAGTTGLGSVEAWVTGEGQGAAVKSENALGQVEPPGSVSPG